MAGNEPMADFALKRNSPREMWQKGYHLAVGGMRVFCDSSLAKILRS